ncbi:hypothetical protein M8C21_026906, partial [Ambrosia artemisiifolia]
LWSVPNSLDLPTFHPATEAAYGVFIRVNVDEDEEGFDDIDNEFDIANDVSHTLLYAHRVDCQKKLRAAQSLGLEACSRKARLKMEWTRKLQDYANIHVSQHWSFYMLKMLWRASQSRCSYFQVALEKILSAINGEGGSDGGVIVQVINLYTLVRLAYCKRDLEWDNLDD